MEEKKKKRNSWSPLFRFKIFKFRANQNLVHKCVTDLQNFFFLVDSLGHYLSLFIFTRWHTRNIYYLHTLHLLIDNSNSTPTEDQIYVPETLLKKRKTDEKTELEKQQLKSQAKKETRHVRKILFKKADAYIKEYKQRENEEHRLRRLAKSNGNYFVPAQPQLLFVIRITGINDMSPKVKKVLQLFRLLQTNNGVFVRLNKATSQMLQIIEPFVTYGPPNLKTVRELVYKRGFVKTKNNQRIPISDNKVIADHLGSLGIICIEDIIHEIFTVGEHFKQANNFLWPFKLSNPKGHKKVSWKPRKAKHYVEGGDAGDREFDINKLIQSMN